MDCFVPDLKKIIVVAEVEYRMSGTTFHRLVDLHDLVNGSLEEIAHLVAGIVRTPRPRLVWIVSTHPLYAMNENGDRFAFPVRSRAAFANRKGICYIPANCNTTSDLFSYRHFAEMSDDPEEHFEHCKGNDPRTVREGAHGR